MIRRPPICTLFPTRRSSDLVSTGSIEDEPEERIRAPRVKQVLEIHTLEKVLARDAAGQQDSEPAVDRKSTRLNSSHPSISYAVFCLKKKKAYTLILYLLLMI